MQSNGQFQFTVRGVGSGKTNLIQASTNLANWSTLSTNLVSTNSLIITDPAVTNSARRYYRVLQFH